MMTCRQAIRVSEGRSLRRDAHSCPRSTDHRASRPRHQVDYGYNSVQEIRSGTGPPILQEIMNIGQKAEFSIIN